MSYCYQSTVLCSVRFALWSGSSVSVQLGAVDGGTVRARTYANLLFDV